MGENADLMDVCAPGRWSFCDALTKQQRLRQEYCPPIDEALFLAIGSEVDHTNSDQLHEFVATLDSLKLAALEQENTDFDPSGTGGVGFTIGPESSKSHSSPEEDSESYGVASVTTGLSELKWDDHNNIGADLEEMSFDMKQDYLKNMFPSMKPYDITFVLKKCKGVLCRAIDELLNLSSLEEEAQQSQEGQPLIPKGIDGFLVQQNSGRGRKGKGKKQSRTNESSRASSVASALSDASNEPRNVWTTSTEDVEFIFSRTNIPQKLIRSVYHANAASLPATIRALATEEGASFTTLNGLDGLVQLQIVDLKQDFQFVPKSQLFGLLRMSRKIPSAARELATVMISSPGPVPTGEVSGIVQYAPYTPTDDADPTPARSPSHWTKIDLSYTRAVAFSHGAAASVAYTKAPAAYRRGKSDPLMNGAARAKAANASFAAAADAHVASQSTSRILDLHGVGVADAVRIAQEKVNTWWESLGDAKYAPGGGGPARDGYRIVTGVGRHSKDGAPKIRPAVSRMLVREGWKVEVGQGETMVYGKARR